MKLFKLFSLGLILSLSFASCGVDTPVDPVVVPKEYAQFGFIHAALDVAGVDISLDGVKKTTAPVTYGNTMPYAETELVAGVKTRLGLTIGTTTTTDSLLINAATLSKSQKVGLLVIAFNDSSAATVKPLRTLTVTTSLAAPTGTKAKINVVHLVADAAKTALDVRYVAPGAVASATSPTIATGVAFKTVSNFFEIDPGTYDMKFLKGGTTSLFVSPANTGVAGGASVKIESGKIYTVVMRGLDNGINEKNVKLTVFNHN